MGQGSSKETKPHESEKDEPQLLSVKAAAPSPAVEATPYSFSDGASPSLSHKLINYFSPKSEDLTPKVVPGHVKYSSASPLPPSSSLLAQGYREELGGISPAQYKRVSSSFFLGKVLISPRRPLRDGPQPSQDLENGASNNASYEFGTPKSLKRKASPESISYSKKKKPDNTASPFLKHDWKLLEMRAQVEEQDEEEEKEPVKPINIEEMSENEEGSSSKGSEENEARIETPVFDANDQLTTEAEMEIKCDGASFHEGEIANEESRMSAPYSPSQPPRNLISAINFSLSSSATCASPAPAYVPHNSTIEELDEDVAEGVNADHGEEEEEGNVTLSQTIGKGLLLLKKTLLGTDARSEESSCEENSVGGSSAFDTCEMINNDDESKSGSVSAPMTPNSNDVLENGDSELRRDEERSCSEARSHCSNDEYELGVNNHPRAGTTHSSTDSKKMLTSEYRVTQSKKTEKEKTDEEDYLNRQNGYDSSPSKATLRSPSSEDSFYHHPLAGSTFSASMSKGKWPSFSMISTSSVSSLPVASFQFFKSIITSESLPISFSFGSTATAPAVEDNSADSVQSDEDCSLAPSQDKPLELPSVDPSDTTSPVQTQAENNDDKTIDDEGCKLSLLPDDSNDKASETVLNDEIGDISKGEKTPENKDKEINAVTPSSKPISPESVTPKRSSRIASIQSSKKTANSNSPTEIKAGTPSNSGRRRRRRSASSESSSSLHTSQESEAVTDDGTSSSRSTSKKQRLDKPIAADENIDIATDNHTEKDEEFCKKSSTSKSNSLCVQGKFEDLALLRDSASAQHARDNQLVIVVMRSNNSSSSALIRELRLQFPLGSFISAAAKHGKKSRRAASHGPGLKQLERNVMQQVSPVIVEAAVGASVKLHLLIAHSANYNSVVLHEAAFSSMLPYQPAVASLPFCYSWFLSLTDSVELSNASQLLLRRLLAVPVIRHDLLRRTKRSSTQEFIESYIRNNTVGGPEILHCTAKGGTSASDAVYTARRDVQRALGQVSALQVVGFVITPRTFGARVKLDSDQLTLWDNSDSPAVPRPIASMFEEQKVQVPPVDGQTLALDSDTKDDAADDTNDILGYKADKKSFKFVPGNTTEMEKFSPTSGLGSRAHITLGCHTKKVHPRTTGFDLLLALQKEKTFNEKNPSNDIVGDLTSVDISDIVEGRMDEESIPQSQDAEYKSEAVNSEAMKNGVAESEAELPDTDDLTMSDVEEVMSVSIGNDASEVKKTSGPLVETEGVPVSDCVTLNIEGAVVRGYGEGVWVVYPERYITASAVFAGFHNSE